MSEKNMQEAVQEKYGAAARRVTEGQTACCGGGATTQRLRSDHAQSV